jgi:hypothetical protein
MGTGMELHDPLPNNIFGSRNGGNLVESKEYTYYNTLYSVDEYTTTHFTL